MPGYEEPSLIVEHASLPQTAPDYGYSADCPGIDRSEGAPALAEAESTVASRIRLAPSLTAPRELERLASGFLAPSLPDRVHH